MNLHDFDDSPVEDPESPSTQTNQEYLSRTTSRTSGIGAQRHSIHVLFVGVLGPVGRQHFHNPSSAIRRQLACEVCGMCEIYMRTTAEE